MSIIRSKVRAIITIGTLIIKTPFILSFNVDRNRSSAVSFSTSLKIPQSALSGNIVGTSITIEAGVEGSLVKIFTGMVKRAVIEPCYDDPSFVRMNMSGTDILSRLEGKKYSRRIRSEAHTYVTIDGVNRVGLRSGKFTYRSDRELTSTDGNVFGDSKVITANSVNDGKSTINSRQDKPLSINVDIETKT